jgi:hypothetical protein
MKCRVSQLCYLLLRRAGSIEPDPTTSFLHLCFSRRRVISFLKETNPIFIRCSSWACFCSQSPRVNPLTHSITRLCMFFCQKKMVPVCLVLSLDTDISTSCDQAAAWMGRDSAAAFRVLSRPLLRSCLTILLSCASTMFSMFLHYWLTACVEVISWQKSQEKTYICMHLEG